MLPYPERRANVEAKINEQCAAMMGFKDVGITAGGMVFYYNEAGDVEYFLPATNRDHLQMCIEFAAKDETLWRRFSNRLWWYCEDRDDCTIPAALLLPTLTLATLLVEAWEETRP